MSNPFIRQMEEDEIAKKNARPAKPHIQALLIHELDELQRRLNLVIDLLKQGRLK